MPQVVHAHRAQPGFAARAAPSRVVHPRNAPTAIWKHPDGMAIPLSLDDRPGDVVEDHDMRSFGLESLGGHDEDATLDFGDEDFPRPLQAAHVAVAQPGVDGEQRHARQVPR
jgi:hypothetical protein